MGSGSSGRAAGTPADGPTAACSSTRRCMAGPRLLAVELPGPWPERQAKRQIPEHQQRERFYAWSLQSTTHKSIEDDCIAEAVAEDFAGSLRVELRSSARHSVTVDP